MYKEPQNLTTMLKMFQYANEVTGNVAAPVILMATFATVFLYFIYTEDPLSAFVVASVIMMFTNVIFKATSLVTDNVFYTGLTVFIIAMIGVFLNLKDE